MAEQEITVEEPLEAVKKLYHHDRKWYLIGSGIWLVLPILATVIFTIANVTLSDNFFSAPSLRNMFINFLLIGLVTPAFVLIISGGGLDLSLGSLVSLVIAIVATVTISSGQVWLGFLAGMAVALAIGIIHALLIGLGRLNGALVTFATGLVLQGFVLLLTASAQQMVPEVRDLNPTIIHILAVIVLVFLLAAAIALNLLTRSGYRKKVDLRSDMGSWVKNALYTGIPYLLSAIGAGMAGIVLLVRVGAAMPNMGSDIQVNATLAALLGGVVFAGGFGSPLAGLFGTFATTTLYVLMMMTQYRAEIPVTLFMGIVGLIAVILSYVYHWVIQIFYNRSLNKSPEEEALETEPEPAD